MEMALQFKAGDYMMYGTVGVCQVKEISRLSFMRDKNCTIPWYRSLTGEV